MTEDVDKETEEIVIDHVALVEVEVVMKIDGVDFRAIIMADRAILVATSGFQAVVLKVRSQVLTMKVEATPMMTSLD